MAYLAWIRPPAAWVAVCLGAERRGPDLHASGGVIGARMEPRSKGPPYTSSLFQVPPSLLLPLPPQLLS